MTYILYACNDYWCAMRKVLNFRRGSQTRWRPPPASSSINSRTVAVAGQKSLAHLLEEPEELKASSLYCADQVLSYNIMASSIAVSVLLAVLTLLCRSSLAFPTFPLPPGVIPPTVSCFS